MTRLRSLTPGQRIVLVAGIFLLVDLLLLPWHSIALDGEARLVADELGFDPTPAAIHAPNGAYGVAAVILTAIMVVQVVIERFTPLRLPQLPIPWWQIQLILGVFVIVVLVFKLLKDTGGLGYGAYSGMLGGLLVAYGGYEIAQEGSRAAAADAGS